MSLAKFETFHETGPRCNHLEHHYMRGSSFLLLTLQGKHFAHIFVFDASNIWNDPDNVRNETSIAYRKKAQNIPV